MTTAASLNAELDRPLAEPGRTHRTSLGLLLWLFGFTGAHRFYYGRSASGTVQFLLFAACGALTAALGPFAFPFWIVPGLWWIVDLFLLGSMQKDAARTYAAGPYSYSVAWVLQTFLGWAGVHRLYLDRWVSGLAMVVCALSAPFLLGLPALICGAVYLLDFWNLNEMVSESNQRA